MRMMAKHQISPVVDCGMSKIHLILSRIVFPLKSPVETYNDDLCPLIFHCLDIRDHLVFAAHAVRQFISTDQTYFHTVDIHDRSPVISEARNTGRIQSFNRICIALVAVIMAVVICKICSLYITLCQYLGIFCRSLKCIGLVLTRSLFRKCSLHINNRQVVCLENRLHILEEIGSSVTVIIRIQARAPVKIFICSESTVSGRTDRNGNRLRFFFLCLLLFLDSQI